MGASTGSTGMSTQAAALISGASSALRAVERLGAEPFFMLLALISLQLGILNLMPVPVLDGGHILILALEGLLRRDFSDRVKERVMTVGFVFLLAFFGVVIFYDILKARL